MAFPIIRPSPLTDAMWLSTLVPATSSQATPMGTVMSSSTTDRRGRRHVSPSPPTGRREIGRVLLPPSPLTGATWPSFLVQATWSSATPMGTVTSSSTTDRRGRRLASLSPPTGQREMATVGCPPSPPMGATSHSGLRPTTWSSATPMVRVTSSSTTDRRGRRLASPLPPTGQREMAAVGGRHLR